MPGLAGSKFRRSRRRRVADSQTRIDLDDLIKSLRALMWRRMGITRDAAGLKEAALQVDRWGRYILPLEFHDPSGWTMQNMLIVARLMIEAATKRRDIARGSLPSRFPETDPKLNYHIIVSSLQSSEPADAGVATCEALRPPEGTPSS